MKPSVLRRAFLSVAAVGALAFAGGCGGGSANPDIGLDPSNPGQSQTGLNNGSAQAFQAGSGNALVQGTVDLSSAQVSSRGASATSLTATITATRIDVGLLDGVATSTQVASTTTDSVGRYSLSLAKNKLYKVSATFTLGGGSKTLWTYLLPGDTHDRTAIAGMDITPANTATALALEKLESASAADSFTFAAINSTVRGYAQVAAAGAQLETVVNAHLSGAIPLEAFGLTSTVPAVAQSLGAVPTVFGMAIQGQLGAASPLPADTALYAKLNQPLATSLAEALSGSATLVAGLGSVAGTPAALAAWGTAAALSASNWNSADITQANYRDYGIEVKPNTDIYTAEAFAYDSQNNTFLYGPGGKSWTYTTVRGFAIIPRGQAPSGGWPTIVYQHGVTRQAADMFMFADDFVKAGYAMIGIDAVMHGRRLPGNKTSSGAALSLAEFTAAAGATADTSAVFCRYQANTRLANVGSPVSNGAAYLFNYFGCGVPGSATMPQPTMLPDGTPLQPSSLAHLAALYLRDNQIQTVEDQRALFTWLGSKPTTTATLTNAESELGVNPRRLYYVGMSLGVMIGGISVAVNNTADTSATATAGRIRAAVFNAGGAGWGSLINTTDDVSFGAIAQALVGSSCPSPVISDYAQCQAGTTAGLGAFVSGGKSLGLASALFTGGDPLNWAGNIKVPVLLQHATDDKVFKSTVADALYSVLKAGSVNTTRSYFSANHGFFLDITSPNSGNARREIISFFSANS